MKINRHIIKKLIEPVINKDIKNHAHITSALMNWLTDSNLETMLEMIHNDGFTTHNIGDIVKFKPETWWFKDEMMWDIMKDWKLMDSRGYIYGKVVGDTGYSEDFDPYHYQLKVKVYIHGEDRKNWQDRMIKTVVQSVDTVKVFKAKLPLEWQSIVKDLD